MKSIKLRNGVELPKIGLGTSGLINEESVRNSIEVALRAGYQHIDTATFYANESLIGEVISAYDREDMFLTTKVWNTDQGYDNTIKAFTRSLENLQTDYLDLYLIHWPNTGRREETWRALEHLYKEGLVRAIGVCSYTEQHLSEMEGNVEEMPMVNQFEMHPFLYQKELLEYNQERGIACVSYSPLAEGKLFGNEVIRKVAEELGKSEAQIMLRWSLQHGAAVIPKSNTPSHIEENYRALYFEIPEDKMKEIDEIGIHRRLSWNPYNS